MINPLPSTFSDDLLFFHEPATGDTQSYTHHEKWKILVVDDDPEVFKVTCLALKNIEFEGKKLELLPAYSAIEAENILTNTSDISVILLDVVMEEDNSGLKLIRYIRDRIKNQLIRIILRTGQPGQAPENKIIIDYDINDYKTKTELTAKKLFTAVISALRNFRDLLQIEKNLNELNLYRQHLERLVEERTQELKKSNIQLLTSLKENEEARYKIERFNTRLKSELELAAELQKLIIAPNQVRAGDYQLTNFYSPSEQMAGDYLNTIHIDEYLYIFIGDVSGHGIVASFFVFILNTIIHSLVTYPIEVDRLLTEIQIEICKYLSSDYFLTLQILRLNLGNGQITYSNAGHPPFIVFNDHSIEKYQANSHFISPFIPNPKRFKQELQLQDDDRLILFTDGLYEIKQPNATYTGISYLNNQIALYRSLPTPELIQKLMDIAAHFNELEDDISACILEKFPKFTNSFTIPPTPL